ncbi:unnamed protein product [Ectocarpus fasciculatus]
MGRVRKYKKVKAMDPFAKGGGGGRMGMGRKGGSDVDRNLPPDVKNHQAQRLNNLEGDGKSKKNKNKRRLPQWAHEELKETAKRVREEHADPEGKGRHPEPQRAAMEGKREDESMRQFNKRVREGTAQLLKDEFKEHSATNKRRKKYLDDKKRKNKLKKQGLWEEVQRRERLDEEHAAAGFDGAERSGGGRGGAGGGGVSAGRGRQGGGGGSGDGGVGGNNWGVLGRADDDEGAAQLLQKERIRFGEVAHAPPDLAKIPKPRGFKDQGQAKPWARQAAAAAAGGGMGNVSSPSGDSGGNKGESQGQQKKGKRNRKNNAAAGGGGDGQQRQEQRALEAEAKKAQNRQMEEMRQRVQEAYSGLKKKRRAGQTQFVGSDL